MKNPFKKSWIMLGIVIFVWTAYWFVRVKILHEYAFVINVVLFTIGYCLLINYMLATIVYWVVKRLKKKWKIKE